MSEFDALHAEFQRQWAAGDALYNLPESAEREAQLSAADQAVDAVFYEMMAVPVIDGPSIAAKLRAVDLMYNMTNDGFARDRWSSLVAEIVTFCSSAVVPEPAA